MLIWITTALLVLVYWAGSLYRASRAARVVPELKSLPAPGPDDFLPRVSVVVPARNEGATIEACLRSLAAQDYPDLEIIAVDDRSTDNTGELIDRLAAEYPPPPPPTAEGEGAESDGDAQSAGSASPTSSPLAVTIAPAPPSGAPAPARPCVVPLHIEELPEGWLGKCNALSQGAAKATGEIILFTDGDVLFEPTTLRRAVAHLNGRDADMLVVLPEVITASFWEQVMILVFGHSLLTAFPPVRAMDRRSNVYVGVGAFNMIRAKYYRKIHGHRFLRLQVVDDAGLGKLVKHSGGTIAVAFGHGMVKVRWQETLWGLIRGLEKNAFAAMRYSVLRTLIGTAGLLLIYWWPWFGLFAGPVVARMLCALAIFCHLAIGFGARRYTGYSPLVGPVLPIGAALVAFTIVRSMVITLRRGGIQWRDSFYSLRDLRQFKL